MTHKTADPLIDAIADKRFQRVEDVIERTVAGEVFLVPIRGELADLQELFALNEVGSWLWARLDGSRRISELAGELSEEYDVTDNDALRDTTQFVGELLEAGLLRDVSAGA